jgi:predicted molibdopterin-dependent oxidoreductase YjgC
MEAMMIEPAKAKRTPGVPNDALNKAAAIAGADIDWVELYGNKVTQLTAANGTLTAGNNTLLVAELIRFYLEAHR